jgi:hypothetical protein
LDYYAVRYGHAGGFKVAAFATLGALAMLRAVFVVGRRQDAEQPGIAVSPRDEPELWRTVTALAHQVRTRVPDEIRLVPDVNAAVSEDARLLGLTPDGATCTSASRPCSPSPPTSCARSSATNSATTPAPTPASAASPTAAVRR